MKKKLNIGKTYTDGLSTNVKIKVDNTCNVTGKGILYLNTTEETSDYLINNNLLNYQVLVGYSKVAEGLWIPKRRSIIYDNLDVTTSKKSITVYIWIRVENVTDNNINNVVKTIYSGIISVRVESR